MRDSGCDLQIKPSLDRSEFESAMSLDEKASSILSSCRICLSSILDPAALTCGHRFCEKCLTQYWRIREKPDYIVCPLCRACAFNVDFAKKTLQFLGTVLIISLFALMPSPSSLIAACRFLEDSRIQSFKREKRESTEDFRKTFTEMTNMNEPDINKAMVFCFKISVLLPALYCLVKWLKIPLLDLFTNIRNHLIN